MILSNMRKISPFLFLSFIILAAASLPAEEVQQFTPLQENERLAFTIFERDAEVTFYAVNNDNTDNITLLFSTARVITWNIQLTGDFKKAFFLKYDVPARTQNIYRVDGLTGEISMILTIDENAPVRVSKDGRFICFLYRPDDAVNPRRQSVNIYLYDIERARIIRTFLWRPFEGVDDPQIINLNISGYRLIRSDDVFDIHATIEMGIVGWAVLDPAAVTLEPVEGNPYRFFESTDGHYSLENPIWYDDVHLGAGNLTNLLR